MTTGETNYQEFFLLWGLILAAFLLLAAIPWIRRVLADWRSGLDHNVRIEGLRAYHEIAQQGAFEESDSLGARIREARKHNPYEPTSRKAHMWARGFAEDSL